MTMSVHDRLQEIFRDVFDDDRLEISDDMTAADVDKWDSVAHLNLMFAVEEVFGIKVSSSEFMKFPNVGSLRAYITERV